MLRPVAIGGLIVVAGAGLAVEVCVALWPQRVPEVLFAMLSLSFEANLPTWYSAILLFGCGLACVAVAEKAGRRWLGLAACFAYISFDEVAEIHENLGGHFGGEGLLYFDWVIPASIAVAALGAIFWPLLRETPGHVRRRLIAAGAIYVGGALLMELPLGYVAEQRGVDNLAYGLIDWVEETMELGGATLFLLSMARYADEQ